MPSCSGPPRNMAWLWATFRASDAAAAVTMILELSTVLPRLGGGRFIRDKVVRVRVRGLNKIAWYCSHPDGCEGTGGRFSGHCLRTPLPRLLELSQHLTKL